MDEQLVLSETRGRVGWVTLNRPKALNALSDALVDALVAQLHEFDRDDAIGAIVIAGSDRAFAAGADIAAMKDWSFVDVFKGDFISRNWDKVRHVRKPLVAAVAGYALGGGCELAMMCDTILCADSAKFGQPEINLGITPGAGGTQRLTRVAGKFKTMKMVLTGKPVSAREAYDMGIVAEVVPDAEVQDAALKLANTIAGMPPISVSLIKEAVVAGQDASLETGLMLERRAFELLFSTEDSKEGIKAFIEKRKPSYKGR